MGTSLDIGPVVQLLGSLSSPSAEPSPPTLPASVSVLLPKSEPVPSCTSERRRLGDFSALWSYLATEYAGSHGGNAVADRPTSSRIPESESLTDPPAAKPSKRETVKTVQFLNRDGISKSLPTDLLLQTSSPAKKSQPKQPLPPSPKKTKASDNVKSTVLRNFKTNTLQNYNFVSPPESLTKTKPTIRSTIPQEQRKLALVQKLLNYFPENKSTLLQPRPDYTRTGDDIHVFVDNSNISIGFIDFIKASRGFGKNVNVRRPALSFHCLSLVLERGRPAAKRVLAGSAPVTREMIEAKEMGYETSILERVEKDCVDNGHTSASSGSETTASKIRRRKVEQGVDEILHMKMFESILDYKPSTLVLASGDGNVAEYGAGFFKAIERCLERQWRVEIFAFKNSLNNVYKNKEFRKKWKHRFRLVFLDDFAEELLL